MSMTNKQEQHSEQRSERMVSEQRKLQLSGFMDGDVPSAAELDAMLQDAEARATWGRYHVIRDAVQNELPEHVIDLSERIRLAVADEPTVLAPRPKALSTWQKAVGLAVAASVFAAVIVMVPGQDAPSTVLAESAPAAVVAAPVNAVADAPVVVDDERARLEELLINHTEAVSANGLNVMLPYARVVSDRIEIPVEDLPVEEAAEAVQPEQGQP